MLFPNWDPHSNPGLRKTWEALQDSPTSSVGPRPPSLSSLSPAAPSSAQSTSACPPPCWSTCSCSASAHTVTGGRISRIHWVCCRRVKRSVAYSHYYCYSAATATLLMTIALSAGGSTLLLFIIMHACTVNHCVQSCMFPAVSRAGCIQYVCC